MEEWNPLSIKPYRASDIVYAFNEVPEEHVPHILENLAHYLRDNPDHTLLSIRFQHDYLEEGGVKVRIESYISTGG